jgi:hypothetical protein
LSCGLKLNVVPLHTCALVELLPAGADLMGTVMVKVAPAQPPETGVTVNTALRVLPYVLITVPDMFPLPLAAPPDSPD